MVGIECSFTATVNVPPDRAVEELGRLLRDRWGPAKVTDIDDGVVVQGGWWYRGEYHVHRAATDGNSIVDHQVRNVAPAATRWMVPLVVKSRPDQHRSGFLRLLAEFGEVTRSG